MLEFRQNIFTFDSLTCVLKDQVSISLL